MRSTKFISLLLTAVLMMTSLACTVTAEASDEHYVRVGLAVESNNGLLTCFSAVSSGGIEAGISTGTGFKSIAALSAKDIIAVPAVSYEHSKQTEAMVTLSEGISAGLYRIELSASYTSYQKALANASGGYVAYKNGSYFVRYGTYQSYAEAYSAAKDKNASVYIPKDNEITVFSRSSGKPIFEYYGSAGLALRGVGKNKVYASASRGSFEYDGFFELSVKSRKLQVINCVDLENYVKGVMSSEIGMSHSDEVTKAFAIMVRTVPLRQKHKSSGYDVCDRSCCQNYRGYYKRDERLDSIVDLTKGMYLTYNGAPIACLYHGSNGGSTCSSGDAWGNSGTPYLTAVALDEGDKAESWTISLSPAELKELIGVKYELDGNIVAIECGKTESGYVNEFSVISDLGDSYTISNCDKVRGTLKTPSSMFDVEYTTSRSVLTAEGLTSGASTVMTASGITAIDFSEEGHKVLTAEGEDNISIDEITITGFGRGHCVGFSVAGADILSSQGYKYDYLLSFYFQGSEITKLG